MLCPCYIFKVFWQLSTKYADLKGVKANLEYVM